MPEHYFCQSCRIAMADPFWQAESIQLIPPAMLRSVPGRPVVIRSSGRDQVMAVDRAFDLSAAQLEPLRKNTQTEQLHVSLPHPIQSAAACETQCIATSQYYQRYQQMAYSSCCCLLSHESSCWNCSVMMFCVLQLSRHVTFDSSIQRAEVHPPHSAGGMLVVG